MQYGLLFKIKTIIPGQGIPVMKTVLYILWGFLSYNDKRHIYIKTDCRTEYECIIGLRTNMLM